MPYEHDPFPGHESVADRIERIRQSSAMLPESVLPLRDRMALQQDCAAMSLARIKKRLDRIDTESVVRGSSAEAYLDVMRRDCSLSIAEIAGTAYAHARMSLCAADLAANGAKDAEQEVRTAMEHIDNSEYPAAEQALDRATYMLDMRDEDPLDPLLPAYALICSARQGISLLT